MGTRAHVHLLPYSADQLYNLVTDIEKYPEFLPWCVAARILSASETEIVADLNIGYKVFRERFRSHVHLTPKTRIDIEYINGPFQFLNNHWIFKEIKKEETEVHFFIDFEFKNSFFQRAAQAVFETAFDRMLTSFEKRAHVLYGKKG